MKLYSYWRSSASYRIRIALNLKGLDAELVTVNLLKGEHKQPEYARINPEMRVPTLIDNGHVLTQSLAILDYLDEQYPQNPLLPTSAPERAKVRALASAIACDISPLGNLSTMHYLSAHLNIPKEQKLDWLHHWIKNGFTSLETMLAAKSGSFCFGSVPTIADCCLIPQLYNARRFNVNLTAFPTLERIEANCATLPAFIKAHPANQPDAVN